MSAEKKSVIGTVGRWIWDWLASYGLACSLLFVLAILTILGTWHQRDHGLHQAELRYFHSWFLWAHLGG